MEWKLRQLRCFVEAVDEGTFTDAAIRLKVSQAAVSRAIAELENALGAPLLVRDRGGCRPTNTGASILPIARRILGDVERLSEAVTAQRGRLRLGYAWAALGVHTTPLLRRWAAHHPTLQLQLIRHNSPTGGLAEGMCDAAIVRTPVDPRRFGSAIVGRERRFVAFASDDPEWARRRNVRMAEVAARTVLIDDRTGTTTLDLWPHDQRPPQTLHSTDVEDWLDAIAAGTAIGTTSEATAAHNPRPGVTYRPTSDGTPILVRLIWTHDEPPAGIEALADAIAELYGGNSMQ